SNLSKKARVRAK
ncbi:hypothetical protein D046_6324B, partial [Vibrio parahaemolyticus V-223/04]